MCVHLFRNQLPIVFKVERFSIRALCLISADQLNSLGSTFLCFMFYNMQTATSLGDMSEQQGGQFSTRTRSLHITNQILHIIWLGFNKLYRWDILCTHRAEVYLTFTPTGNLKSQNYLPPECIFLGSERKPEHLEKTHADTKRTCNCHTETSWPDNLSQDLLAVRRQH